MSWLYSRALVAEYSEGGRLGGEPSALLSTNSTPPKYYYIGKIPGSWKPSRYGMMSEPLTADLGEDLLMLFQEASLARTSVAQARAQESAGADQDFGLKWRELSAKYDLAMHGWKTHRCLFPEGLPWSSVILPKWGTLQIMALLEHIMPGHLTREIDVGYLQGGDIDEWLEDEKKRTGYFLSIMRGKNREKAVFWSVGGFFKIYETEVLLEGVSGRVIGKADGTKCEIELKGETIPQAVLRNMFDREETTGASHGQGQEQQCEGEYSDFMRKLSQQGALENEQITTYKIMMNGELYQRDTPERLTKGSGAGYWPTATAKGVDGGSNSRAAAKARGMWPTPAARDYKGANSAAHIVDGKRSHMGQLPNAVAHGVSWPTPTVQDFKRCGPGNSSGRGGDNLRTAIKQWPTPLKSDSYPRRPTANWRGDDLSSEVWRENGDNLAPPCKLAPDWVEWVMGWPIGHTDIERDTVEFVPWSDGDPADTGHTPRTGSGIKNRAARLKAIGNGQVPQAMVLAWEILSQEVDEWQAQ